jgi:hypothetical protein
MSLGDPSNMESTALKHLPQQLLNLLHRLGHPTQTKWNVRIMERYAHGTGVVTYLARYLRGGPPSRMPGLWRGTGTASPSPIAPGRRRLPARALGYSG